MPDVPTVVWQRVALYLPSTRAVATALQPLCRAARDATTRDSLILCFDDDRELDLFRRAHSNILQRIVGCMDEPAVVLRLADVSARSDGADWLLRHALHRWCRLTSVSLVHVDNLESLVICCGDELRDLSLHSCSALHSVTLPRSGLPRLRRLSVHNCRDLSIDSIARLFNAVCMNQLGHVELVGLKHMLPGDVASLRDALLRPSTSPSPEHSAIARLVNLRTMTFKLCGKLAVQHAGTDASASMALGDILLACPNLRALDLSKLQCQSVHGCLDCAANSGVHIPLSRLRLFGCADVCDATLDSVGSTSGAWLRCVDLSCCRSVTAAGVASLLRRCTSGLISLHLWQCTGIALNVSAGLQDALVLHAASLETLNLNWLSSVDDAFLSMTVARLINLGALLLEKCSGISCAGVEEVLRRCTRLHQLNIGGSALATMPEEVVALRQLRTDVAIHA